MAAEVRHLYEGTLTNPFERHAADCFGCEIERLRDELSDLAAAADWYRRCLEGVIDRTPVRGLAEARANYDAAYARARESLERYE